MIQNGNPYRTLFSRAYRPQLVITVLVGQGSQGPLPRPLLLRLWRLCAQAFL
jgi:hypothetical protein